MDSDMSTFCHSPGDLIQDSQSSLINESQQLAKYFLNDASDTNVVSFPDPSQIITDRIDSECNRLPKDSFVASLLEICQNDTDTLEQLRLYYFKVAKCREDFSIQCPVLKRRVNPRKKSGEPLVNKLGRVCYTLRLASRGEFCDDLKETFSSRSVSTNLSNIDVDVTTSAPNFDTILREKLIQLESTVLELKASNSKTVSNLTNKIDLLYTENKKLHTELNKQKERHINIQSQLNIIRSKNNMLKDAVANFEKTQKTNIDNLTELSQYHKNNEDKTTTLSNKTKYRLDSEIIRITKISDSRASGLCNLKSKVSIMSNELKEINTSVLSFNNNTLSNNQSVTELRKRMNALEENVKQLTCSNQMSYALATSKPVTTDLTTNTEIRVDIANVNNEADSLLLRDAIVEPVQVNHPKKNVEKGSLQKKSFASVISSSNITTNSVENVRNKAQILANNGQHKIPVHFPSSVCSTFKGVVQKKKVSRFYVGGIDKRNGSEKLMRKYLEDRNVKVTFIRYFDRPNKRTASAQLNVISDDEPYICDPHFWPCGNFTKPWLSWQQFVNEHSIVSNRRNGIYQSKFDVLEL
ncbi:unnamed protein product [Mytilus coruscus]|uniref:Uncharacterized protein n=1 Tax=Mytilus coruscus TaxID=42192 RepID=A0A6J8EKD7_MYTCO|nr:unnamed protein product [Mytilus coruscus]